MSTRETLANGWQNGSRRFLIVGAICTVALAVSSLVLGIALYQQLHSEWTPLGRFPPQVVTSRVDKHGPLRRAPGARLGHTLDVTATKCNDTKKDVATFGSVVWQQVDKPELAVRTGGGAGKRPPGCQTLHFENPIPPEVVQIVRAAGIPVRFRLVGIETPVRDQGGEGRPAHWTTAPFVVAP